MYNWGDPHKDLPIETFEFGDKVMVLSRVPLYGGAVGTVVEEDLYGVTVKFRDDKTITFDADDLTHVQNK